MAERLIVEVVGDDSSFRRTLQRSSREAKRFEATIGGVGRTAIRAFGGTLGALGVASGLRALVGGIQSSITAASNLNEQVSRSRVVFGDSAGAMVAWSRSSVTAAGLSQRAALEAASTYGTLFTATGQSTEAAAENSKALVQVAADLRSISNTDMEETLNAIRSGLVGEAEPLRRFGILLSETRVQQEAMRQTGKRTAAALTEQEKVTARLALIQQGAAYAAGDFARTSDGLANQSQMLTANLENLRALIGEALLPAVTDIVTGINEWLGSAKNQRRIQRDVNEAVRVGTELFHGLAEAIELAADAYGTLEGAIGGVNDALDKANLGFLNKGIKDWGIWDRFEVRLPWEALPSSGGGGGPSIGRGLDAIEGVRGHRGPRVTGARMPGFDETLTGGGGRGGGRTATERAQQLNQWFDARINRMLGRVGDVTSLRGQIRRLQEIAGLVRERLAVTKDITRRLTLEDQLADIQRDITSRESQIVQNARDRERERKENERLRKERERERERKRKRQERLRKEREAERERKRERQARIREERQFERGMDWLEFAAERAAVTKTNRDDLRIARMTEKRILDRIKAEGRTLELVRRLWRVRDKIKELNKSKADSDPLAGLMQVSSRRMARALAAGTGLDAAGRRILEANVAAQEIHNYVYMDGREVARSVNRANAATAHRTSRQTSGLRGG